jgi:hypothetical protein
MCLNFVLSKISLFTPIELFNVVVKSYDMGRRLNFPPKEVVLLIFIAHKNPSLSARFEPSNPGFNGKHDNHYTTENDR